jgi:S-adenosylmethionine:tRNA ribosyltransferase-isomerase
LRLQDFDYGLPEGQIAQAPAPERDAARLLYHRIAARATEHRHFRELPDLLPAGALVVVNDTRVVRARLRATKPSGGAVELMVVGAAGDLHRCLARPTKGLVPGMNLVISGASGTCAVVDHRAERTVFVRFEGLPPGGVPALLASCGEVPLPPYIRRPNGPPTGDDAERYQTVYARAPGAIAAPTAGLHFSPRVLGELEARGCEIARLTLHVGPGTFAPVVAEDPREHALEAERYEIPPATAVAVARARAQGRLVVAVGTTVVRALESAAERTGEVDPVAAAETGLMILPGHQFRVVSALITNFHLPRTTLLMLVAAFAGRERVLELYAEAVREGYRFYSYGDAMLLCP